MKTSKLAVAGAVALAACAPTPKEPDPLCDREAVEWDKWGTDEVPAGCAEPEVLGIVIENVPEADDGDDPRDRRENPDDPEENPDDPDGNPDDPDGNPDDPGDQPTGRKDNGLGNGDQAAPGGSLDHNRAENRVGNPGHASGKPQNSN